MSEPDERFKEIAIESPPAPIRWDRVASRARRRRRRAVVALVLLGLALTVVIAVGALAGKVALDPSFSPPILGSGSAPLEVSGPRLGQALVTSHGAPGYVVRASLEAEDLQGKTVFERWQLRPVGGSGRALNDADGGGSGRIIRISNQAEVVPLRDWLPRPRHTGGYVAEVHLESLGGEELERSHGPPLFVIGGDCCRRYVTPTYRAVLPKGWSLEEDFTPNPGDRFVTLARGPYDNSVDIDSSTIDGETVLEHVRILEGQLSNSDEGYRRLDWQVRHSDGQVLVEWSYELEGDAFANIQFHRGSSTFAVLGRSNQNHFRETRDLTRLIARSVDPR
jgi:hypothetical protein